MHLHTRGLLEICSCVFSAYHCIICGKETVPGVKISEEIVLYLPQHIPVLPSGKVQTNFEDIVFYEKNTKPGYV